MAGDDRRLQAFYLLTQGLQLREQSTERLACECRQCRGTFFDEQHSELADTLDSLRRDDAEFGKLSSDGIHQHGSLPDQQITRTV